MPFGEYKDFEECIAKNSDKENPEAYCAAIKKEAEGASISPAQYAVFTEPLQISEDVTCCLKVNAVIAKEGVYSFPAGKNGETINCLWSKQELLKATPTARAAKIAINGHPPNRIVTKQSEMYGVVEKPFFDRDRIRAILSYDKLITPPEILEKVRLAAASKERKDATELSIGFYYASDFSPGNWHGQPYDMIMRDMVIDHVATALQPYERGRCKFPNCGIGVSSEEMNLFMAASVKKNEASQSIVPEVVVPPVSVTPPAPVIPTPPTAPATVTSPSVPVKVESKTPPLTTQELIERNQTLLQLKQKRSEQQHIEALRHQRRNPLSS
jgi:hypothetical protein